ncbi:mitochondrial import inner membrane translocase subunit tim-17 [Pyrenophora seminiperda CCB06]|uniref:Mitochondrial import inner membrane translocase subunit tim-17 n=1 Tax=Pyrenophora seminiperda CCB06 TaxID=1302712 RepID=A0A3M7M577_9PLEO|nr:mitochondrial import inner membrane translocase subunit tim-17 [Pyrenophora seminiperda CCB06]
MGLVVGSACSGIPARTCIICESPQPRIHLRNIDALCTPLSSSMASWHSAMSIDHSRDPCPWVALREFGRGSLLHGALLRNNLTIHSLHGQRRISSIVALRTRALVLGGNCGVWAVLFSTFGFTMYLYRLS